MDEYKEDYNVVVVLGNGFDLDLGLKTRYSDFMDSTSFKDNIGPEESFLILTVRYIISDNGADNYFKLENINLLRYLNAIRDEKRWIDLEIALSNFAKRTINQNSNEWRLAKSGEKEDNSFQKLHDLLCDYLGSLNYGDINTQSKALALLSIVNRYEKAEILNFNYTDIHKMESLIGTINTPIDHIHGSISDRSIILGIQDDLEIDDSYCYMIKSFSPNFRSHNVREKLLKADEIIIFGHSLGSTDYHYFQDLFRYQSQADKANKKLIMRIFTYDENSRRDILIQLRNMNEKRTDMLYDLCDFEIYRTGDGRDSQKIDRYMDELTKRLELHSRPTLVKPHFPKML